MSEEHQERRLAADLRRAMAARGLEASEHEPLPLRIGVDPGDVMVEGDDLYGDGLDPAMRLEGEAEPDGVVFSLKINANRRSESSSP